MFTERVQLIELKQVGTLYRLRGEGLDSGIVHRPMLREEQLHDLIIEATGRFDGDPLRFRLGVEALRLGIAYEYDRYFSLSIARVDPLLHQIEAVYDHFLKQPRIRFLLADDPCNLQSSSRHFSSFKTDIVFGQKMDVSCLDARGTGVPSASRSAAMDAKRACVTVAERPR